MSDAAMTPFAIDSSDSPPVRGFLHRPPSATGDALILSHGASANCRTPLLVAVAQGFAAHGVTVLRCDLPYRQAVPTGPPPRDSAPRDRAGIRAAVAAARALGAGRVFLGGHSYGGRQSSMLAAEDPAVADALLLLSYPLHPPRRPTELRTAHLPQLRTPALFVHGTRDPFGSLEELRAALSLIPAPTRLLPVEDGAHSLSVGVAETAVAVFLDFARVAIRA